MITNDQGILRFKHSIFDEICRLAFNGELNEKTKEELPYKIIEGPKPVYRCCIYKEREIVKQRINLATGNSVTDKKETNNIIQVINAACDECPISAYSVTDNCRFCLGHPCESSCKFGALKKGEFRMIIDGNKCKECGMCAKACPFQAIVHLERPCKRSCPAGAISYDENGYCIIDEAKCIRCGHCIHSCPFGAISSKSYLVQVISALREKKEIYLMFAPATEGQFGKISMSSLKKATKELGFADMVEVGLGGDMTAASESIEWSKAKIENKKLTTSCCPAFVNMLKKQFNELYKNNMSKTISPMCAVSRYLKTIHPNCMTVFVGPCVAKKSEAMEMNIKNNADYVLTYGEFRSMLRAKNITLQEADYDYQEASIYGKKFGNSGGVAECVLECMKERGEDTSHITYVRASGGDECRKALLMMKMGKMNEDFIEGMICQGGCVGGPSKHLTEIEIKNARKELLEKADNRKVLENLSKYPMDKFSMERD